MAIYHYKEWYKVNIPKYQRAISANTEVACPVRSGFIELQAQKQMLLLEWVGCVFGGVLYLDCRLIECGSKPQLMSH